MRNELERRGAEVGYVKTDGGLASEEHPRAVRRLLVLDRDALTRVDAPEIDVRPAYEWLLTRPAED